MGKTGSAIFLSSLKMSSLAATTVMVVSVLRRESDALGFNCGLSVSRFRVPVLVLRVSSM